MRGLYDLLERCEFEKLIRQYLGKENGEDIHFYDVKLINNIQICGDIIAKESDINRFSEWL